MGTRLTKFNRRQKQEGPCELETSQGYRVRLSQASKQTNKNNSAKVAYKTNPDSYNPNTG